MAKKKVNKADLILALKDALVEQYNLPIEMTPELDQFTLDMLWSYYEVPGHKGKVISVLCDALVANGIAKDIKTSVYNYALEEIILKWQGRTKVDGETWRKLLQ